MRYLRDVLVFFGLVVLSVKAEVGTLDPGFSSGLGTDGIVTAISPLPSGQILVAGLFTTYNGSARPGLARINADGRLDTSYTPNITAPASGGVATLLRDSSGRTYIGGVFTKVAGADRRGLARLNSDGSLDPTFSPELPAGAAVATLAFSLDGTALFVGGLLKPATDALPNSGEAIRKLAVADGRADPAFTIPGLSAYDHLPAVYKILPLADGRILIAGEFNRISGVEHWNLCRLRVDGNVDPSFTLGTPIVWTQINDIDVDAAGRIYLSGDFIQIGDFNAGCIARLTPGGAVDQTFKFPATVSNNSDRPIVNNLLIDGDGRLTAVGNFAKYNNNPAKFIVRTFDDGTVDPSFTATADNEIVAIETDAAGSLLIGGSFQTVGNTTARNVARLLRNGDAPVIRSFPTAGSVLAGDNLVLTASLVNADTIQWYRDGVPVPGATGSWLALASASTGEAGVYTMTATSRYGGTTSATVVVDVQPAVAGARDPGFVATREPFTTGFTLAHTESDAWIALQDGTDPKLIRYDTRFVQQSTSTVAGFKSFAASVARLDTVGRIWVTGQFTLNSGLVRHLVRLTAAGNHDATFDSDISEPSRFSLLQDGSILVQSDQVLRKLTSSGAIDQRFTNQPCWTFASLADGRILCAMPMIYPQLSLARLNVDGSIDTSFTPPTVTGLGRRGALWPMLDVNDIALTSAGEIAVTTKALFNYAAFLRLRADGTLISNAPLTNVEQLAAKIVGVDRSNGVVIACGSLGYYAADGTSRTVLASAVPTSYPYGESWQSTAQGLLLRVASGNSLPPAASAWTYVRLLADTPGEFRIMNLSGRGIVGTDEDVLIVGFVTSGVSGGTLVRGIGPSLRSHGVDAAQTDVALELYRGGTVIHHNDNWSASLAPLFTKLGAFTLTPGSADAAVGPTLGGGVYTAMLMPVSPAGGVGLAEIYDASDRALKLVNVSIRGRVAGGEKDLFGGFVISGTGPRWVLIRAVGPSLAPLGINHPLRDPKVTLMRGSEKLAENDNWSADGNSALYAAAAQKVGAMVLPTGSKDALIYVKLQPGLYSVIVSPADDSPGVAVLEIYSLE